MRITFCGVRGSTQAPGTEFARYGGHTSCVAVSPGRDAPPSLILDAGTGLRAVTGLLGGRPFTGTILLTHLHWDHTLGLPFFRGGDRPDARVTVLMPEQDAGPGAEAHDAGIPNAGASNAEAPDAEALLARVMSPPFFPITPGQLRGAWSFGFAEPGEPFKAEGFEVLAREIPHKGGRTFGYRVSDGTSVLAYVTDHCPTAFGPGPDGLGEYHPAVRALAAGADLLIHDAQLTAAEVPAEAAFGHAAAEYAAGLARAAGARRVALFHHKPDRTDAELDAIAAGFAAAPLPVTSAAEGSAIDI